MKRNIYAIYDNAAGAFMQPFFLQNDGMAVRAFSDSANGEEDNSIKRHPDQFALYRIGGYDDTDGAIWSEPQPERIMLGMEVVDRSNFKENDAVRLERKIDKLLDAVNLEDNK